MFIDNFLQSFQLVQYKDYNFWILNVLLILLATLLIHYLEIRVYHRIITKLSTTKYLWDDALVWSIHKPFAVLVWLWGLSFVAITTKYHAPHALVYTWIDPIRTLGTILIFTWFFLRLTNCLENKFLNKTNYENSLLDPTTGQALAQIVRISILFVLGLIILKYFFNTSLTGLWALGGAGSFIIGWAAKDLLANFFGALMIYLDRPFSLGDWIRSPDRQIEGTVEYIGWRLTKIRTLDKRPLYIPNSLFATICVENPSQMTYRRIYETIGISYTDVKKLQAIIKDIGLMLKNHPDIDKEMTCSVNLTHIGGTSLEILVNCFTKTTDSQEFLSMKQDIILSILQIIEENHAEVAFATSILKLPENAEFLQSNKRDLGFDPQNNR
jgi:MscS family membrane protein